MNLAISKLKNQVGAILLDLQMKEDYTVEDFDNLMGGEKVVREVFYSWARNEMEKMEPTVSRNHLAHYTVLLSKLKGFKPNLRFLDLSPEMIDEFRNHLILEHHYHANTMDSNR